MPEDILASPGADAGTPGEAGQTWQDQFLAGEEFAELREDATLKGTPDIPTLAKRLVDTKALVGRKGVIIPKEDAPPEDWERYYTELGRPASPDAYEIKPEGLPEDFPYSLELEGAYRKLAFEAGLSPKAAKLIYDGYNKFALEMEQQAKVELQNKVAEMEAGLKKEWGSKYQENLAMAREGMNMAAPAGSPELLALDQAMGGSPVLVKFFYNLRQAMSEGQFVSGPSKASAGLEAKRQELMRHPAYLDLKHAEHQSIVDQVTKIYEQLHAEPAER